MQTVQPQAQLNHHIFGCQSLACFVVDQASRVAVVAWHLMKKALNHSAGFAGRARFQWADLLAEAGAGPFIHAAAPLPMAAMTPASAKKAKNAENQ
jgi:hypothetical protein